MLIEFLTLFPEMFQGPLSESILKRAQEKGVVDIRIHDLREFALDRHQTADDRPYGGGSGMVMLVEPIVLALEKFCQSNSKVLIPSPRGERFDQKKAAALTKEEHLIFICGHYEGIDERVFELFPCEPISIGDFVLTNGEVPSALIADSVIRLLPGVLGNPDSLKQESFEEGLLEYPHYTRPAEFRGKKVPDVLLSGDHQEIEKWRQAKRVEETQKFQPDMLKNFGG